MTPLFDQDGREVDKAEVVLAIMPTIWKVIVTHDEVSFLDSTGTEVALVTRLTHPGAGLAVSFADSLEAKPS